MIRFILARHVQSLLRKHLTADKAVIVHLVALLWDTYLGFQVEEVEQRYFLLARAAAKVITLSDTNLTDRAVACMLMGSAFQDTQYPS